MPYARIQNVDGVQTVFHRLLKVVDVKVQTAGGNEPEATMSVLPVDGLRGDAAARVRRAVAGRGTADPAADVPEPRRADAAARCRPATCSPTASSKGAGMVVIAAMFGLMWEFGVADSFMPRSRPVRPACRTRARSGRWRDAIYSQTGGIFDEPDRRRR